MHVSKKKSLANMLDKPEAAKPYTFIKINAFYSCPAAGTFFKIMNRLIPVCTFDLRHPADEGCSQNRLAFPNEHQSMCRSEYQ